MPSLLENIKKVFKPDDGLRVNLKSIPDNSNEIGVSSPKEDLTNVQIQSENSLLDSTDIEKFVTLSQYRDERYRAFEDMLSDPLVSATLEMYADDATQYNLDGNIIWVESDDDVIAKAGNRLLKVLDIQNNAWRHIYSLCTYGDLYFRLYKEGDASDNINYDDGSSSTLKMVPEDTTRKLEERIEYVNNPATIFDLQDKDKTTGFIKIKSYVNPTSSSYISHNYYGNETLGLGSYVSSVSSRDCELLYNRAYVHIMLSESINRQPEFLSIDDDEGNSNIYKIKTGKSALEDAYAPSQTVNLLNDSLVLNRLSKSAIIRLLQIEVGDIPKAEGENIMRRLKNMIEQKMSLNSDSGSTRSYNSPGPLENVIYVPTKNGKGAVNADTIGGDVNIKDIVDIEYFQNLELAALKVPKQFLNFDSAEGFSNGTSLTKTSSRYAHTIMRIQTAYIRGITNLLNIFFIDKGLDYVNKFKVKMVSPATVEESERNESFNDRLNQTRDIIDLAKDAGVDDDTSRIILVKLLNDMVGIPEIANAINDSLKSKLEPNISNNSEVNDEIADDFQDLEDEIDAISYGESSEPETSEISDIGTLD